MALEVTNTSSPAKLPLEQHGLFLYPPEDGKAATKFVDEALSRGQLVVYVPVNRDNDTPHISDIESEITNYEDNMNRGNLLTLDMRSFYNFLLSGNMEPFEELKVLLEEAMRERIASGKKNDEGVTFVSGIAGTLATNQRFEESINAEKWWQKTHSEWLQKGLKVTMICSHPSTIFDKKSQEEQFMNYKRAMLSLHQAILDPSST
jgi:hypothetical protein